MTGRLTTGFFIIAIALALIATRAFAQETFYKGKSVRIIVGGSAGGGYDTYTRTIARHLSKHVPGNPTFVVENKPGIEFDGRKFEYLGVPAQDNTVIGIAKAGGVTSIDNWLVSKTTLKSGGVGPGSATDDSQDRARHRRRADAAGLRLQRHGGHQTGDQ